jgi:hypothetical protein
MKTREETTKRLRLLMSCYSIEYLHDLDVAEKEKKAVEKAKESDELTCFVMVGEQNAKVMLDCMKSVRDAIEYMKDEENIVENWQLAGINAMLEQANEDHMISFDLGYAICGILGTEYCKKKAAD